MVPGDRFDPILVKVCGVEHYMVSAPQQSHGRSQTAGPAGYDFRYKYKGRYKYLKVGTVR